MCSVIRICTLKNPVNETDPDPEGMGSYMFVSNCLLLRLIQSALPDVVRSLMS